MWTKNLLKSKCLLSPSTSHRTRGVTGVEGTRIVNVGDHVTVSVLDHTYDGVGIVGTPSSPEGCRESHRRKRSSGVIFTKVGFGLVEEWTQTLAPCKRRDLVSTTASTTLKTGLNTHLTRNGGTRHPFQYRDPRLFPRGPPLCRWPSSLFAHPPSVLMPFWSSAVSLLVFPRIICLLPTSPSSLSDLDEDACCFSCRGRFETESCTEFRDDKTVYNYSLIIPFT